MRLLRTLLIVLALGAPAFIPAAAVASGDEVIQDCADDGVIDGRYSDDELREAERDLPSDVDEYTDCREAIRAELGSGGGRDGGAGGGGGGGGSVAADPSLVTASGAVAGSRDDIEALDDLTRGSGGNTDRGEAPSIDVGGRNVTPGAGGKVLGLANSSNELPLSMLSALVLLALSAIAGTVLLVRRRGLPAPVAARLERLPSVSAPAFLRRVKLPGLFRR